MIPYRAPGGHHTLCGPRPPLSLCASRFGKSKAGTGAPQRCCPSVSPQWTRDFQAAGSRAGRCMRSPAAATARSTAPPPRSSPPGIAARTRGKVLWCVTRQDLFAPALAQAGLKSDRVIYLEAGDDKTVLACFEEGLRHGGLGAVVAEVARLPMTASRRLQLAAEGSGTIGIALRRWRRQTEAADFGQPTAATTRWRVSALPSAPLPVPGVGRPRWLVELIRCRAGESADFELEACDDTGRLALPADLVHGPVQAEAGRRRASA